MRQMAPRYEFFGTIPPYHGAGDDTLLLRNTGLNYDPGNAVQFIVGAYRKTRIPSVTIRKNPPSHCCNFATYWGILIFLLSHNVALRIAHS